VYEKVWDVDALLSSGFKPGLGSDTRPGFLRNMFRVLFLRPHRVTVLIIQCLGNWIRHIYSNMTTWQLTVAPAMGD